VIQVEFSNTSQGMTQGKNDTNQNNSFRDLT